MNDGGVEGTAQKNDNSLLRTVISLVCLYAANVQFLLSLKLIFYEKEFATLGLSFVLLIVFLLPFLILGQKVKHTLVFKLVGLIGSAMIGLVGAVLVGLLQQEAIYAVLIGASAAVFGVACFGVSGLVQLLCNQQGADS